MKKAMLCGVSLMVCVMVCLFPLLAQAQTLEGYDPQAGYQYVQLGVYSHKADGGSLPITWRVLSAENGEAYLLSEYVLFAHCVHGDFEAYVAFEGEFNQTDIFAILNGEFIAQAFTQEELAWLISDETLGTVFLVESDDLKNKAYGFTTNASRQAYGTAYALSHGLFKYRNGSSPYWTRSRSSSMLSGVRCTKTDGSVGYIRCVVMDEGIRPAIRVDQNQVAIGSGKGTLASPYILKQAGQES